jgi:hypothetical protein
MRGDSVVHVSSVERGIACGCTCPACGQALVAKKGPVLEHHFAHATGTECATALETALHLAAKEILERRKQIVLPEVRVEFDGPKPPELLAGEACYFLCRVLVEHRIDTIMPDIVAFVRDRRILIEIRVTHPADAEKISRIGALGLSAIEIDLSQSSRSFAPSELEELVVEGVQNKKWLHNSAAERRRKSIRASGEFKRTVYHGLALHVLNCPINARTWRGNSYANVTDDCSSCDHAIEIGSNPSHVVCGAVRDLAGGDVPTR